MVITGFDAPCLSTLYIDRQPMTPQSIIQAFSRTNRLFDKEKQYGQVVTFQAHEKFKDAINYALTLYSRGGTGEPVAEDWETVRDCFAINLNAVRGLAPKPSDAATLSREQKKAFIHLFRDLDKSFSHLKAFSVYDPIILEKYDFSDREYEDYAGVYKNILEELKEIKDKPDEKDPIRDDYELTAYSRLRVDFEYIMDLLQGFVDTLESDTNGYDDADFAKKISVLREAVGEYAQTNPKTGALLLRIIDDIERDKEKYIKQDISVVFNEMRYAAIDIVIRAFSEKWCLDFDEVRYEAFNFRGGELANENQLKEHADYASYCEKNGDSAKKFKFRTELC